MSSHAFIWLLQSLGLFSVLKRINRLSHSAFAAEKLMCCSVQSLVSLGFFSVSKCISYSLLSFGFF